MNLVEKIKNKINTLIGNRQTEEDEEDTYQSPQNRPRKRTFEEMESESTEDFDLQKKQKRTGSFQRKNEENIIKISDDFDLNESEEKGGYFLDFGDAETEEECQRNLIILNYSAKKVHVKLLGWKKNIFEPDIEEVTIGPVRAPGLYKRVFIPITFFPLEDRTESPVKENLQVQVSISEPFEEGVIKILHFNVQLHVYNPDGARKRKFEEMGVEGFDSEMRETKRRKISIELSEEETDEVTWVQEMLSSHFQRKVYEDTTMKVTFLESCLRGICVRNGSDQRVFSCSMQYLETWQNRGPQSKVSVDDIWNALKMLSCFYLKEVKNLYVLLTWMDRLKQNNRLVLEADPVDIFLQSHIHDVFTKYVKNEEQLNEFIQFLEAGEGKGIFITSSFLQKCLCNDYSSFNRNEGVIKFIGYLVSKVVDLPSDEEFWRSLETFITTSFRNESEESRSIDWNTQNIEMIMSLFDKIYINSLRLSSGDHVNNNNSSVMKSLNLNIQKLITDLNITQLFSGLKNFWNNPISRVFLPILLEKCQYDKSKLLQFLELLKTREETNDDLDDDPTCQLLVNHIIETKINKIITTTTINNNNENNNNYKDVIQIVMIQNNDLFSTIFKIPGTDSYESIQNLKQMLFEYISNLQDFKLTIGEISILDEIYLSQQIIHGHEQQQQQEQQQQEISLEYKKFVSLSQYIIKDQHDKINDDDDDEGDGDDDEDVITSKLTEFSKKLDQIIGEYGVVKRKVELYDIFRSSFLTSHISSRIDRRCENEHNIEKLLGRIKNGTASLREAREFLSDHPFHSLFGKMKDFSTSELFLRFWNETIHQVIPPYRSNSQEEVMVEEEELLVEDELGEEEDLENLGKGIGNGLLGEGFNAAQPQLLQQQPVNEKEVKLLTLEDLKEKILPPTIQKMNNLFEHIYNQNITLEELENTFKGFSSEQIQKEILFLFSMNNKTNRTTQIFLDLVKDAFFMISRSILIPRINKFQKVIRIKLKTTPQEIREKEYRNLEIKKVASALREFKEMIVGITGFKKQKKKKSDDVSYVDENIMELIGEISESDDLVRFLMKKEDNSEFNKFINVIKTITTDEFILNCSFQLSQARNHLSKILYPSSTKFSNITKLLETLRSCFQQQQHNNNIIISPHQDEDEEEEDDDDIIENNNNNNNGIVLFQEMIGSIRTSRKHLKSLELLFEKRTTSLDYQALDSLIQIETKGIFIFESLHLEEKMRIRCETITANQNNQSSLNLNSNMTAAATTTTVFRISDIREIKLLIMNSTVIKEFEEKQKKKKKLEMKMADEDEEDEDDDADNNNNNNIAVSSLNIRKVFEELQKLVDTLHECSKILTSIQKEFSFEIMNLNEIIVFDEKSIHKNNIEICKYLESIKQKYQLFREKIEEFQDHYYFLNYFSSSEICMIVKLLLSLSKSSSSPNDNNNNINKFIDFLRLIDFKFSRSSISKFMDLYEKKREGYFRHHHNNNIMNSDERNIILETIEIFGGSLEDFFTIQSMNMMKDDDDDDDDDVIIVDKNDQNNSQDEQKFVIIPQNHVGVIKTEEYKVLNIVSSLLPDFSRSFLICNENTSINDLKRFIRRFEKSKKYHPVSENIFVVADVAILSFETLYSFVNIVKRLSSEKKKRKNNSNTNSMGSLFIVTSEYYNFFSSIMYDHSENILVKSQSENLKLRFERTLGVGGKMKVVKSRIAGGGKSEYIFRKVWKREFCDLYNYHRVPIYENICFSRIIEKLALISSSARSENKNVFFHFDLASYVDRKVDSLIFQLIHGTLRDERTCKIFHVHSMDKIYIELANTGVDPVVSSSAGSAGPDHAGLPFKWGCPFVHSVLPSVLLEVKSSSSTGGSIFPFDPDDETKNKLQLVCKYLKRYRAEDFTYFDPWCAEYIELDECFNLIVEFLGEEQYPSYRLIHQMIDFLFYYFELMSGYEILQFQEVSVWLTKMMMDMIIQSSEEFVKRHMKISTTYLSSNEDSSNDNNNNNESNQQQQQQPMTFFNRYKSLKSWEDISKPILVLKLSRRNDQFGKEYMDGFTVMSLDDNWKQHIQNFDSVDRWLSSQQAKIEFDFRKGKLDTQKLLNLIHSFQPQKINRNQFNGVSKGQPIVIDDTPEKKEKKKKKKKNVMKNWNVLPVPNVMIDLTSTQSDEYDDDLHGSIIVSSSSQQQQQTPEKKKNKKKRRRKLPFVFTKENTVKIFGILLRLKVGLPIIMRGETGVGKTYQIEWICSNFGYEFHKITVHEGLEDSKIIHHMKKIIRLARSNPLQNFLVFFDEINTRPSIKIFELIINDRILCCDSYNSDKKHINMLWKIPPNVKFVAALNPYRRLKSPPMGLIHPQKKFFPSNDLVYRVFPFPESFIESIFDFGSLRKSDEEEYANSMLLDSVGNLLEMRKRANNNKNPNQKKKKNGDGKSSSSSSPSSIIRRFTKMIIRTHKFLRSSFHNEESICSLRDIQRFITIFKFLLENDIPGVLKTKQIFVCYVNAIGFAYYSGLNRKRRREYLKVITRRPNRFKRVFRKCCTNFSKQLFIDPKCALNEALTENLWMTWLGIQTNIPVLIIGLPGSSKSLTTYTLSKSFRGEASVTEFCRNVDPRVITIFDYQLSPSTKSKNILSIHDMAKRYQQKTNETVVLCLEELGLANVNPYNPLKVLHEVIANRGDLRFVAISNYDLDHANMNRFKLVFRDKPMKEDLILTSKALCDVKSEQIQNLMSALSSAFLEVCNTQKVSNFFGLREFYYLIRSIMKKKIEAETGLTQTPGIGIGNTRTTTRQQIGCNVWSVSERRRDIINCVMRNFGGVQKDEEAKILNIFNDNIPFLGIGHQSQQQQQQLSSSSLASLALIPSEKQLIEENLVDPESRHLLLVTRNNSALNLLWDMKILSPDETIVLFGSDFIEDRNDDQRMYLLDQIKMGMSKGMKVVLVFCNCIFEAIFDLLNQNYSEIEGKKFAKLALGHSTSSYMVSDDFRLIIIVDEYEVSKSLSAPFLNRLEKRLFYRGMAGLFQPGHYQTHKNLEMFCKNTLNQDVVTINNNNNNNNTTTTTFCTKLIGFHKYSLESLQMAFPHSQEGELMKMILRVASPETVLRSRSKNTYYEYFHEDVVDLIRRNLIVSSLSPTDTTNNNILGDDVNNVEYTNDEKKIVVMTNTAITMKDWESNPSLSFCHVEFYLLHEMKRSRDLSSVIKNFLQHQRDKQNVMIDEDEDENNGTSTTSVNTTTIREKAEKPRVLVLYADTSSVTRKQILYTQHEFQQQLIHHRSLTDKEIKYHLFLIIKIPKMNSPFTFDFDNRWTYLYEDDLNSIESFHFPMKIILSTEADGSTQSSNMSQILKRSIGDNLNNLRITQLREFIVRVMCFLNYPEDVYPRTKIEQLERFYRAYKSRIRSKIIGIIEMYYHGDIIDPLNWWMKVERNNYDSFKNSIHRFLFDLYAKGFACILEMCDQNNNLKLIFPEEEEEEDEEDESLQKLWFEFFESYSIESLKENLEVIDVHGSLSIENRYDAEFPFSHLLISFMNSLRYEHINNDASSTNYDAIQKNQMDRFFPFLNRDEYKQLVKIYAGDYFCIHGVMKEERKMGELHNIFLEKQMKSKFVNDEIMENQSLQNGNVENATTTSSINTDTELRKRYNANTYFNYFDIQKMIWCQEPEFLLYLPIYQYLDRKECLTNSMSGQIRDIRFWLLDTAVSKLLEPMRRNVRKWNEMFHKLQPSVNGILKLIETTDNNSNDEFKKRVATYNQLLPKYTLFSHFLFRFDKLFGRNQVTVCVKFWKDTISKLDFLFINDQEEEQEQEEQERDIIKIFCDAIKSLPGQSDGFECCGCKEKINEGIICKVHSNCHISNEVFHQDCITDYGFVRQETKTGKWECTCCGMKRKTVFNQLFRKMTQKESNTRRRKFNVLRNASSLILEDFINEYILKLLLVSNNYPERGRGVEFVIKRIVKMISRESVSDDFLLSEQSRLSIIRNLFDCVYQNNGKYLEKCFEDILQEKKQRLGHIDSDFTRCLSKIIYNKKLFQNEQRNDGELKFIKSITESKYYIHSRLTNIISFPLLESSFLEEHFKRHPQVFIYFLKLVQCEKGLCFTKKFLQTYRNLECFKNWIDQNENNRKKYMDFISCLDENPFQYFFRNSLWNRCFSQFQNNGKLPNDEREIHIVPILLSSTQMRNNVGRQNQRNNINSNLLQRMLYENQMLSVNNNNNQFFGKESMFLRRVIVHTVSLGWKRGTYFHTLLNQPQLLRGHFIPTNPTNEKEEIVKFLGEGQVWKCECGYEYWVGECSRPMEAKMCPRCKKNEIGGRNHSPSSGQTPLGKVFTSKPNYICSLLSGRGDDTNQQQQQQRSNNSNNIRKFEKIRNLTPKPLRVLRFLINVLLFFNSHCKNDGITGIVDPHVLPLVRRSEYHENDDNTNERRGRRRRRGRNRRGNNNNNNSGQNYNRREEMVKMSERLFFHRHIMNDWRILCVLFSKSEEDVSIGIQCVISKLLSLHHNFFPKSTRTKKDRENFENKFLEEFPSEYFEEGIFKDIENVQKALQDERDGGSDQLSQEVMEWVDIPEIGMGGDCPRARYLPSLFGRESSSSLESFWRFCSSVDEKKFPLIRHMEHHHRIERFHQVVRLLTFSKMVFKKLNRRISPNEAMNKTIGQWLLSIPRDDPERDVIIQSFEVFKSSFNHLWWDASQYECQSLTDQIKISEDSKLSLLLPQPEKSDDIFSSVMMIFMKKYIDFYNEFVEIATRKSYKWKTFKISPQFLHLFKVVKYDEKVLLDFIQDHPFKNLLPSNDSADDDDDNNNNNNIQKTKKVHLNLYLKSLQYFIFKSFFTRRPMINLEEDEELSFEFADGYRKKDFKKIISRVIHQVQFLSTTTTSPSMSQNSQQQSGEEEEDVSINPQPAMSMSEEYIVLEVLKRLHPNQLRKFFQVVETGIQYLNKPCFRYQIDGNALFYEYLRDDILIPDIEGIFPRDLQSTICMKNIVTLFDLLEDLLKEDVFVNVSNRYKQKIEDTVVINEIKMMVFDQIQNDKTDSVKEFLKILKDSILRFFTSDSSSPEECFFVWIEAIADEERHHWIVEKMGGNSFLKKNVLTKHCCHFHETMADCINGL